MKQDPNELRVAEEEKSIKVDGFSTREQLCFCRGMMFTSVFCIYILYEGVYQHINRGVALQSATTSYVYAPHREPDMAMCAFTDMCGYARGAVS